jgi:enterochelin esterase-like enzyme
VLDGLTDGDTDSVQPREVPRLTSPPQDSRPARLGRLRTATADSPATTARRPARLVHPTPQAPAPTVEDSSIAFAFRDTEHRLAGVSLWQEVRIPTDQLDFGWAGGSWTLRVARPAVDRMEYLLELQHADGGHELITDPANPRRVPGAFGDKSVIEFTGYRAPWWVGQQAPAGRTTPLALPARSVLDKVVGRLWSPADVDDDAPLPLLVAHDGPEYDELAGLTSYLSVLVDAGRIPPLRAALLAPGPRDDWYSANGAYTRALGLAVLPALRARVATTRVVGMGASLGALAMLHAHRRHSGLFDALFLQSGSFFHPRYDAHERRFPYYKRVIHSVDSVLRATGHRDPVPCVLTCGSIEENVANNRIMARALAAQGYRLALHEVRDVHNYVAWRDAFDPHLTALLRGDPPGATQR